MPLALWTLIWLNARATVRKTTRQLGTVRGVLFFIVALGMLALWLGPSIFLNIHQPAVDSTAAMAAVPAGILLFSILNLFSSAGERAVTFTPPEVDFLFPGPFSRRQLLTYKLTKTALTAIFSALLFGIVLGRLGGSFLSRAVGVWLLFQFFQLLAMVVALLQSTLGERIVSLGRRWVFVLLGTAAVVAVVQVMRNHPGLSSAVLVNARDTTIGRIVLGPFKIFAHALLAPRFFYEGLGWAAMAAAIDLVMVAVVIGLDANYLETAASASARRYDRLARMRRSGLGGMANAKTGRRKIRMLPWLAGTGPVVWRQLTTAVRTARTLLIVLLLIAIAAGVAISKMHTEDGEIGFVVGLSVYLNLFLSQMFRFDFRGDLDHIDVLRSLPLRPSAVAAAQLVVPAVMLSMVQLALLTTIAVAGQLPIGYLLGIIAFILPLNLLSLGVDNLIFLLFPFRPKTAVAGDMTMAGRQTIGFLCRFLVIGVIAAIAAGVGLVSWWMTDRSIPLAATAAWFPLVAGVGVIVWMTGMVYERFDPSVSTPA